MTKSCRVLCLISIVIALTAQAAVGEVELHVSLDGRDNNPGTIQKPFRSIGRAQSCVRALVSRGLDQDVSVVLHSGTYELSETLIFGPQDAGTAQFAVRYAAARGEVVTLSGGRRLKDWRLTKQGAWKTEMPARFPKWSFRQLVVDDRRAIRARWPDRNGMLHIVSVDRDVKKFSFDQKLVGGDLANQNAELVVLENWSVTRGKVVSSNGDQLMTATPMGWIGHGPATTASPGKAVFLEHSLAFLDQPGEWFLEHELGVLTYNPRAGQNPTSSVVVAPVLQKLVEIRGSQVDPVLNLEFHRIQFEHCDFLLPEIGYNEIQSAHFGTRLRAKTFVQPVAIECSHAHGCRFTQCRFAHLNSSGIGFGPGCQDNEMSRCTVEDVGGAGIMIGWRGKGELEDGDEGKLDADWKNKADVPTGNVVSNCLVRRCGSDSFGGVGIFVAFSKDTRVAHNQIHDLPYTGISIGYRWNTSKTSQTGCIVEHNHIFDVMKKLADGGGIYTLGYQPGTVLRGNYIHDVHRSKFTHGGAPNNGFFIDEGSKALRFESNVVHSTSGDSVRFNNCQRESQEWDSNYFGEQAVDSSSARHFIDVAGIELPDLNDEGQK